MLNDCNALCFFAANEVGDNKECAEIELACSRTMHCEYGIERWVDEKGCESCRCHNPCITTDPNCPPNTTCSVEMQRNEQTGDIEYHAVCRPGIYLLCVLKFIF